MPEVQRSGIVKPGGWRTIESGWNVNFTVLVAQSPAGTQLKVRYGGGWPFGKDSQKQTSNGTGHMSVSVGKASLLYARVQVKSDKEIVLTWTYMVSGP